MSIALNIPMWIIYASGVVILIPVLFFACVGVIFVKGFGGGIGF